MKKGNRLGPGLLRLMVALFVLAVLAVVVRDRPVRRRGRKRGSR